MTNVSMLHLMMTGPKTYEGQFTFYLNPLSFVRLAGERMRLPPGSSVFADGILMVLVLRWFGGVSVPRLSFDYSSMAKVVLSQAEQDGTSVAVVGGTAADNLCFVKHLNEIFPALKIVFSRDGFFRNADERQATITQVLEAQPGLLLVGMGAPLQERFVVDSVAGGFNGRAYTCGAFVGQAGRYGEEFYPAWSEKFHMRWLIRSVRERGLLWRYLFKYPLALLQVSIAVAKVRRARRVAVEN